MREKIEPIVGDPKRQAVGPQRGYSFQAWQSVHQWITLKSDEVLYLEGGEDIDILKQTEATTIQVKDTAAAITLNSTDVLDAIAHFWSHQTNNRHRKIWFHFLTTSRRGQEIDKPFGEVKGLDYWDKAKQSGVDLTNLRSFLKSKTTLPTDLLDFLNTWSDDELRENLIQRFVWDIDSESQGYLKTVIEERLIDFGSRVHSLPASESKKVLPHLFARVWDVVCRERDRSLKYSDFATYLRKSLRNLFPQAKSSICDRLLAPCARSHSELLRPGPRPLV